MRANSMKECFSQRLESHSSARADCRVESRKISRSSSVAAASLPAQIIFKRNGLESIALPTAIPSQPVSSIMVSASFRLWMSPFPIRTVPGIRSRSFFSRSSGFSTGSYISRTHRKWAITKWISASFRIFAISGSSAGDSAPQRILRERFALPLTASATQPVISAINFLSARTAPPFPFFRTSGEGQAKFRLIPGTPISASRFAVAAMVFASCPSNCTISA